MCDTLSTQVQRCRSLAVGLTPKGTGGCAGSRPLRKPASDWESAAGLPALALGSPRKNRTKAAAALSRRSRGLREEHPRRRADVVRDCPVLAGDWGQTGGDSLLDSAACI